MTETSNTQRGVPIPPAVTRAAKPATAASMPATIAPPFLPGGAARMVVAAPAAPVAPVYQLSADELNRIAYALEQLAQLVRDRQLAGLDGAQGPEDVAGILIAAITDQVGRGG
jgi:hypothetical protein